MGGQYGSIFEILLVYVEKILILIRLPDYYSRSTPRHQNLDIPLLSGILRGPPAMQVVDLPNSALLE